MRAHRWLLALALAALLALLPACAGSGGAPPQSQGETAPAETADETPEAMPDAVPEETPDEPVDEETEDAPEELPEEPAESETPQEDAPEEPESAPAAEPEPAAYDPTTPVASEEFVLSNGVAMDMTYEAVLACLGDVPDAPETPGGDTVTIQWDGILYGFYPAEDGSYRLDYLNLSEECKDVTIFRGIGVGMPIDEVFAKIPAWDTELKQWAVQTIYDEGSCRSTLSFVALSYYALDIFSPDYHAAITFSRAETAVKWVEIYDID